MIDYTFNRLKDKDTQKINYQSLLRGVVGVDLVEKIPEEEVESMIEYFAKESGEIDEALFKEIF